MVLKEVIAGVEVVIEVRAVGGLGWTWSYYPEQGAVGHNTGRLLRTEQEAALAAQAAAAQALGG
ncbi:MAG: hypothetical protein EOO29_39465 [Comamonadaceae bacterium]|nr:MAG: hypothetical protein EOO29_39465 [Comamonadaceae bacterium]